MNTAGLRKHRIHFLLYQFGETPQADRLAEPQADRLVGHYVGYHHHLARRVRLALAGVRVAARGTDTSGLPVYLHVMTEEYWQREGKARVHDWTYHGYKTKGTTIEEPV